MNEIKIFENKEFGKIRTVEINSEPYFVGKDVAEALGYAEPRSTISKKVESEDRGVAEIETPSGTQRMTIINESGLYSLILSSKLESAKRFKHWVTSEVLPSLRKNGGYIVNQENMTPEQIIAAGLKVANEILGKSKLQINQLKKENLVKDQLIGELKPKADYTDIILKSKSLVTISQIAKDYGISGQEMNQILHEMKIQFKQNGQWLLYSKYQNKGYTHSETIYFRHTDGRHDVTMITKWTQKGRLFLYEALKKVEILPVIEQE